MRDSVVNQQLIAEQLNLSRTTVSRCFTNHPGISPDTRSRVFKLAASLGYTYQEGRTGKKSERKTLLNYGVLICTDPDSYADADYENPGAALLSGVSESAQLQKAKLDINYVRPRESSLRGASYLGIVGLQDREWDGVILIYPFPEVVIEKLDKLFPVVSLVEQFTKITLNSVDVNHNRGVELAVEHLRNKGHDRIGFLTHSYDVSAKWSLRRHSAFLAEIGRHGIKVSEGDIIDPFTAANLTSDQINERALEQTRQGVTAWVCAADHQGYLLHSHLRQAGLSVPDDVAITGFDGIKPPDWAPPLTTIRIPYHEIGLTGVRRLNDLVNKRFETAQDILIGCQLQQGETT